MPKPYKKPTKSRKWRRARALQKNLAATALEAGFCPKCGEQGAHFVPPSLGEEGFYTCEWQ